MLNKDSIGNVAKYFIKTGMFFGCEIISNHFNEDKAVPPVFIKVPDIVNEFIKLHLVPCKLPIGVI